MSWKINVGVPEEIITLWKMTESGEDGGPGSRLVTQIREGKRRMKVGMTSGREEKA